MTETQTGPDRRHAGGFEHEAFFYGGVGEFVEGTASFVEAGLRAGEPVMVALVPERLELLRHALGPGAGKVRFADMRELGRNPARIIPAWRRFVDEHAGHRRLRGIGEPIWAARGAEELTECQRHEALMNVAFDGGRPWSLLCPYDARSLSEDVLHEARRSHPFLAAAGGITDNLEFVVDLGVFDGALSEPGPVEAELGFDARTLRQVRAAVSAWAAAVLSAGRAADLALAAHEVAANSVRHGGGTGSLRAWRSGSGVVVEIRDGGRFETPLVGRQLPPLDDEMGRGLWLAQQLCDLVQLRSSPEGSRIRLHVAD